MPHDLSKQNWAWKVTGGKGLEVVRKPQLMIELRDVSHSSIKYVYINKKSIVNRAISLH